MSRDNTSKLPLPEPPDALTEAVARLIEPRVWETWDRRAEHKGWGPAERRLELALALDRPLSTMAASVEQARQIIVRVRADQEGQLGLPGWRCVNCKRVYECGQEPGRCECGASSWAHIDGTPEAIRTLHIVFDGPPGHESGRFIECETPDGQSVSIGEWHERADGWWELRVPLSPAEPVLVLGVEDETATPVGRFERCPICLKANPCDRHSLAVQIRALDDPEYLEQVAERPAAGATLNKSERLTLEWISQAESSALGECKGPALDRLVQLGLVEIGEPDPRGDDWRRVRAILPEAKRVSDIEGHGA